MASIAKKIKRQQQKDAKKELKEKMGLFSKLEDECLVCQKSFDKKNKQMVMTWSVVVKEEAVRLYCPECWNRANNLIKEIEDGYKNAKSNV